MHRLGNLLRQHAHVFIVVALLTLLTTFPTIAYVFKTDVFWHPAGASRDVYIEFWDIWYGKQFLTGQADPFYTDLMFYPEGVSLVFHPFVMPHIIAVNALNVLMPVSNAFSLAYLLIIVFCALSAYVYLHWLFSDKWIALLGAVVFGLSPHVVGHPFHPGIAFIATIPLTIYCFQRGISEQRRALVLAAGLLAGLTIAINFYVFVCLLITLGFAVGALGLARWRDKGFWLNIGLLAVTIAAASAWRVYPMLANSQSIAEVSGWHGAEETNTDAISNFVNYNHTLLGQVFQSVSASFKLRQLSQTSYLGFLPLLLVGLGLFTSATRQKMLPWVLLCALFLILRLGSHLHINGADFPHVLLPKHYLNQLLPVVFSSFWEADMLMIGALLPFAALTCYGLVALQKRYAWAAQPAIILALVGVVAFEYHMTIRTDRVFPVGDGTISPERFAFLDWLEREDGEIRLINLPMGRDQSKVYNLYQSLSGYPHAEGAISRTPDSAFDYIRANRLLNAWHEKLPISCRTVDRDSYLAALEQLETDGFSHVVLHLGFKYADRVIDSFRAVEPSYTDEYVWIFRLRDLRDGCTGELSPQYLLNRAYADALQRNSIPADRHGFVLIFPPALPATDSLARYLDHFADTDRTVVTVIRDDQGDIRARSLDSSDEESSVDLEDYAALWLVNVPQVDDAERTPAFQDWFARHFHFCQREWEDDGAVVDLYLRIDVPCSAMDDSSALEVAYDSGVRLHNASFAFDRDRLHFYLAWTNAATGKYAFSLQFFDEAGNKALQSDHVIRRRLLSAYAIDASSLPAGDYSIKLIVYDFETQVSQGGVISDTGQLFERELEIGRIKAQP